MTHRFKWSHFLVMLLAAWLLVGGPEVGLIPTPATICQLIAAPPATTSDTNAKSAAKPADAEEQWDAIYMGNSRIGFGRTVSRTIERDGNPVVITEAEQALVISRFGQSVKTRVIMKFEETQDGNLLTYEQETQNPPAAVTRIKGKVVGDKLKVSEETAGKVQTRELDWNKTAKSPAYIDRSLKEKPLSPEEERTFTVFDPQFSTVCTATIVAEGYQKVKLWDGKEQKLLKAVHTIKVPNKLTREIVLTSRQYMDTKGETLKMEMDLLKMVTYPVPKEEALKSISGAELDLTVSTLIKVQRIENSQNTSRVVYRITTASEDPAELVPASQTQEVKKVGPEEILLTVKAIAPPEKTPAAGVTKVDDVFLKPSQMLQTGDELVKKLAEEAAGKETDPWKTALRMERSVYELIKKKNFSTLLASAAEVAKTRSGDCTEHAVLLAAMARVKKIPSRLVVGLVYAPQESAFAGHMWTEVSINGTWIPLDATIGNGGIGADHIKFGDSSFDDAGVNPVATFLPMLRALGKMKIEVQKVEHK